MSTEAMASRVHAWMSKRTPWQRRGIAFLAGALAVLGQAPFQLTLLYVVAITVLVWLLDGAATAGHIPVDRNGHSVQLPSTHAT